MSSEIRTWKINYIKSVLKYDCNTCIYNPTDTPMTLTPPPFYYVYDLMLAGQRSIA